MKTFTIKKISSAPGWSLLPSLEAAEIMWLPDCGIRMQAQLCCDSERLFVHLAATEKNIRGEEKDPLDPVCNDSCMEFFFDPLCDGRYFNFEINPLGNIYLGFGCGRDSRVRLIKENAAEYFSIRTCFTAEGWEAFYSVPLEFIRQFCPDFDFSSGRVMRANVYKCGDRTLSPHYLAWNPLNCSSPDFHRPADFGRMVFL